MFRYTCLNPIAQVGLNGFDDTYEKAETLADADAVLVRSAKLHEMELPEKLCAIARAGAGVNNIPLDKCADHGIVVFNTPGANANGVKELVFAGMLLAAVGCGLVLRFWDNGVAPALMLAVCAVAQGCGQRSELFNRWTDYHYYGFRYENKTLLTDPVWEQIAASGRYSHLAFATFDFEHDEFWDLVDFAADHGWTSNSFYMAHMDGNLAAVTLPGELNELSADTLYAFIDEDELARNSYDLHYYRLDGILIGSVEPIDGIEEEPAPEVPARTMDLTKSDVDPLFLAADGIVLGMNGEMMTEEWTLFPGRYRVTLTGSGFDHSYIYARYGLINQETYKLDIDFTGIDPNEMTFEFTATEMLHYWRTAVHTLDDANVTVNSVTVEKVG